MYENTRAQTREPIWGGKGKAQQIPGGNSGIWGAQTMNQPVYPQMSTGQSQLPMPQVAAPAARKVQTLEEVEAAMLAASRPPSGPVSHHVQQQPQQQQPHAQQPQQHQLQQGMMMMPPGAMRQPPPGYAMPPMPSYPQMPRPIQPQLPVLQQQAGLPHVAAMQSPLVTANPRMGEPETMSREDEEARLKRAQRIGHMARYNNLMSQSDKNYVLKVQISQLVSEDPEADDFYYTVHSALQGRTNPHQSLDPFAQTYLMQHGQNRKRNRRQLDNPLLKMQQQVAKVIAAAKARPKPTGLAVEGSLGKLSFNRVRQPRQVLNVKRTDSSQAPAPAINRQSEKEILRDIERVYSTLLDLEQTGRQTPLETASTLDQQAWKDKMEHLADLIWKRLRVMDSVAENAHQMHPFIQILQHSKGKKLIPRIYRSLTPERRLTLITMVVAHLDMLDVVRYARHDDEGRLPVQLREDVELFTQTVLPPLLAYTSDAPLSIVTGLLGMLLLRNDLDLVCSSKVGLSFMTMFVSRAEIIKQSLPDSAEVQSWYLSSFSPFTLTKKDEYIHKDVCSDGRTLRVYLPAIDIVHGRDISVAVPRSVCGQRYTGTTTHPRQRGARTSFGELYDGQDASPGDRGNEEIECRSILACPGVRSYSAGSIGRSQRCLEDMCTLSTNTLFCIAITISLFRPPCIM